MNDSSNQIPLRATARLTSAQRLKTPSDFQRVYRSKQWGGSQHFTYNVLSSDQPGLVLGVTVSKKVSKAAVQRNRIKRQIKEFVRLQQQDIRGASVVITAKPSCREASDDERAESLRLLWAKLLKWQQWNAHQQAKTESP